MRTLLIPFLFFLSACDTPQSVIAVTAPVVETQTDTETQAVPASFRSRLQFGATTALADAFIPFEYEQGLEGFRISHPFISLNYNPEQGIMLKGDVPEDDSGELNKFALLVRPEHITTMQDEEVQRYVEGILAEMEDRAEGGEDPQALALEIGMRFAEAIVEENYSISACLYQVGNAICSAAGPTKTCCADSASEETQSISIWNHDNLENFRFIADASFPKSPDVEGSFNMGGQWNSEPASGGSGNWFVNEGEDSWDYKLDLTDFLFAYMSNLLPARIDWRAHSMPDGWAFPAEAWFSITLPSRNGFEEATRAAITEGVSMGEMLLSKARENGHLIPKTETAITESSYKQKLDEGFEMGLSEFDKALTENPILGMILGREFRFGMTASRPTLAEFEPGYFLFEVPRDRTVIEVVPMLDMFGRMGLSQFMTQMNTGPKPEQEEVF